MSRPDRIPPLPPETDHADARALWAALEVARPAARPAAEREAAWAAVAARLAVPEEAPPAPAARPAATPIERRAPQRRPAWATRLRRLPVAAALLVALAATGWRAGRVEVEAPAGTRRTVTLPDGSIAELNGGSSITYARGFRRWLVAAGGERTVALDGEAFFSVTKDARPFVVRTWNARVTVLGTRFGVRARDERGGGTSVAVEEGRVRVAAAGDATTLAAGEAAVVAGAAGAPARAAGAPVAQRLAWRTGGFAAVDLPLDAIARELERRYDVRIDLRDAAAGADRLTLYYPDPAGVEAILTDVCTARALHFRRTSRGYEVY